MLQGILSVNQMQLVSVIPSLPPGKSISAQDDKSKNGLSGNVVSGRELIYKKHGKRHNFVKFIKTGLFPSANSFPEMIKFSIPLQKARTCSYSLYATF
jgi:hypothetical protein